MSCAKLKGKFAHNTMIYPPFRSSKWICCMYKHALTTMADLLWSSGIKTDMQHVERALSMSSISLQTDWLHVETCANHICKDLR